MTRNGGPAPDEVYIDTSELKALLGHPNLVVYDASIERVAGPDGAPRYRSGSEGFVGGHIPTAIHADLFEAFSDPASALPFTRPSLQPLRDVLASHGIGDGSIIVVYDTLNGVWAARLWWVLKAAGLKRVHLLKGNFAAWVARDGEVETGESAPTSAGAGVSVASQTGWFSDLADVGSLVGAGQASKLVCTLRPEDFRRGRIPGSRLLPYQSILDAKGAVTPTLAEQAARALGFGPGDEIVLYCGGGVNAAGVGAALRQAGYRSVSVYDGSLAEWSADPARPMARGDSE